MKAKRFLSMLVALTMLVSVFSGMTIFAEDVAAPVTASVGDADLAGATDVALSFRSVIALPKPVATGADLSGIVITDGKTDLAPASVTEGAPTDGLFTSIYLKTPVLAQGTTYTLVVPAIGDNAAAEFNFTTVSAPYFVKEDFDDGFNSPWTTKVDRNDIMPDAYLGDADGDGVKDMLEGIGGDSSFALELPSRISLDDINEPVIETRVRYKANRWPWWCRCLPWRSYIPPERVFRKPSSGT